MKIRYWIRVYVLILVMELIYNAVWFTDTILNCKCKKLPTNFNRPSAQNSNISIVFKIGLERASVTVKDKSVLFFLLMLGGNSDVFCEFLPGRFDSSIRIHSAYGNKHNEVSKTTVTLLRSWRIMKTQNNPRLLVNLPRKLWFKTSAPGGSLCASVSSLFCFKRNKIYITKAPMQQWNI